MNPNAEFESVFPLDAPAHGSAFPAVRLASISRPAVTSVALGNRAFLRTWAGRRLKGWWTGSEMGAQTNCELRRDGGEYRPQEDSAPPAVERDCRYGS